jgi:hypothetical protein
MPKISFAETTVRRVRVQGSGDNEYIVTVLGAMPQWCTCPSFEHRAGPAGEFCKHMKARHGSKAKGVTRCARCPNWLEPEELLAALASEIPQGSITCAECNGTGNALN